MNKIIKGKKYDTATAKLVYETPSYKDSGSDLYKKKTGEFFIVYWSKWEGSTPYIKPISIDEAKEYAEEHMDADGYEELFGEVEE